jgi:hypothetical protein
MTNATKAARVTRAGSHTRSIATAKRETTLSLTIEFEGDGKVEIHTLNPGTGDHIERFGGSRHALFANKTASIVQRSHGGNMLRDLEMDIYDHSFWEWIARLINGEIESKCKATATPKAEPKDAP